MAQTSREAKGYNMNINHIDLLQYGRYAKELSIDVRAVLQAIADDENDFESDNYRFIRKDDIDVIMCDELRNDEYMLGCFNAWFLADILGTSTDIIEKMQKAEAFEGIGAWVLDGHLDDLQQAYVSADSYGHHFNSWDGSEDEVGEYYVFRTN